MKPSELENIQIIIGYAFKNVKLLERAFIHSSYANEHGLQSYDRLEFLGDGVLGLIVAEKLFALGGSAGQMTELRAKIVSTSALQKAFESLGLEKYVLYGMGERRQNHSQRKVLADVYEAILGAIYTDGGYIAASAFVDKTLSWLIEDVLSTHVATNYKGQLQEYCQAHKLGAVTYELIKQSGLNHKPTFSVAVIIGKNRYATATGGRKRDAEMRAAELTLKILRNDVV